MKYLPVLLVGLLAACGGSEKPAEPTAASAAEVPAQAAASMAASTPSFTPVSDIKPVWQIMDIAGQPQAAVEKILGQPQGDCENNKYGKSCRYTATPAEWEIVYIKGKADWITLRDPRIDNALTSPVWLGLPFEQPDVGTPAVLHWHKFDGLREYSVFVYTSPSGGKNIDYIYIKTTTE